MRQGPVKAGMLTQSRQAMIEADRAMQQGEVKAGTLTQQGADKANKVLEQGIVKAGKSRQGWQGNAARWGSVEAAKETQSRLQSNAAI